MPDQTDEQIVQHLVDVGTVSEIEQDTWLVREGYRYAEGFELNRRYGVGTRTLQKWAKKVRDKITVYRVLKAEGDVRWGVTIADGHEARFAQDRTARAGCRAASRGRREAAS